MTRLYRSLAPLADGRLPRRHEGIWRLRGFRPTRPDRRLASQEMKGEGIPAAFQSPREALHEGRAEVVVVVVAEEQPREKLLGLLPRQRQKNVALLSVHGSTEKFRQVA